MEWNWLASDIRPFEVCVDFWRSYKIGRNHVETAPHGAALWTAGRGERNGPGVLARRVRSAPLSRYERSKFASDVSIFGRPTK